MTNYEMTTIASGTRIRKDHNTFAEVLGSTGAGLVVKGDELWTALVDGNQVKAGDKWLRLTFPQVGWMAFIHIGVPICKDFKEIGTPPPPPVPTPTTFNVSVHIGAEMGITSVDIEGDETKPFNIILNGRVIWP